MNTSPEQVLEPDIDSILGTGADEPVDGTFDSLDPDTLTAGVDALRRFLRAADGHLPEPELVTARTVLDRAGERLELSRDHTVVALVGATGSGKSSMFNALAGLPLSKVGVRRPTTSFAHACAWGSAGAGPLLDWLAVPPSNRFDRESALDGDELAALRGLILLDLPDFDSIEGAHRAEVDRLLRLVDLVIWVLDPQKYADRVIHDKYLKPNATHRDITLVVLNQVDTLDGTGTAQCLTDLRRLLDEDGLTGVPLLATSTVTEGGLEELRSALEAGVAAHEAYLWRLAGDLKKAVHELEPFVAVAADEEMVDRTLVRALVDTMAASAGVPAALDAMERDYLAQATAATGWLVPQWLRRLHRDPFRRLSGDLKGQEGVVTPAGSPHEQAAAQRAVAALAARELAERAARTLPEPWPAAVVAAALARQDDIPPAIARGIARTDLAVAAQPNWWRTVGVLQWCALVMAAFGLGWLVGGLFGVPLSVLFGVPVAAIFLGGGLALGLLSAGLVRPMIQLTARAARARARRRLNSAVAEVASDLVVAPVRGVLQAYSDGRAALSKAR